jgi:predicted 2-oxoglutarate/Fe(II)-dependent dioxygenase YbiX
VNDARPGAFALVLEPHFLNPAECERIRDAMDRGIDDAAEIIGDEIAQHDTIRRTRSLEIETGVREWLEGRLDGIKPAIEQVLGRPLGRREGTGFLRYPPGGFYVTHRDRGAVAGWPAAARRAASVVVFLNDGQAPGRGGHFEGGMLCLYPDPDAPPVQIRPEAGLLLAFPSDTLHEVLPVVRGTRDAAVDWFYD